MEEITQNRPLKGRFCYFKTTRLLHLLCYDFNFFYFKMDN